MRQLHISSEGNAYAALKMKDTFVEEKKKIVINQNQQCIVAHLDWFLCVFKFEHIFSLINDKKPCALLQTLPEAHMFSNNCCFL